MQKILNRLTAAALLTFVAWSANAQVVKPSSQGEVTWARAEGHDLSVLRAQLEATSKLPINEAEQNLIASLRGRIAAEEVIQPWLLSVDFPGGSLKKLLALIGKATDVSISVISAEADGLEVGVPAFSLRNASVGTIVAVVGTLLETRGYNLKPRGDPSQPNIAICVLTKLPGPAKVVEPRPSYFESFPVGQYLADQSIDDIVGAIRAGWELDPAHDKDALKLKFHQPTAILLVSGPPEATNMAGKIISQLRGKFDKDSKSNLQSRDQNPPPDKK